MNQKKKEYNFFSRKNKVKKSLEDYVAEMEKDEQEFVVLSKKIEQHDSKLESMIKKIEAVYFNLSSSIN